MRAVSANSWNRVGIILAARLIAEAARGDIRRWIQQGRRVDFSLSCPWARILARKHDGIRARMPAARG